ncbi:stalk domain-containing protein [Caldisericum exile]|uniref:Fibronectin type-III domain-containing protein n=1 Tax=Caldisericum exile (strain DSM 21853 / NBRC 104410 / AZM16c01) TaxID=511051 RepID=A0A7U6GDG7_CALEA|nr:stalk domain-containing protein [Caldisericum exile]BAL80387.1 hypothetical protein CSE_02610 [Caldisericum exile AZM16c01]
MPRNKSRLFTSLVVLIVLSLVSSFVPSGGNLFSVNAGSNTITVKLWVGKSYMEVNGLRQPIDAQGTTPVIVESRTFVPIRAIIEALGGSVQWDASTRKVSISLNDKTLELWINNPIASLNGISTAIDPNNPKVAPLIINGRTMLPLRFVAESLGITVSYDNASRMITLEYVTVTPPEAPVLVSPSNGSTVSSDNITFSWMPIPEADYYAINISSNGSTVHTNEQIKTSTYSVNKTTLGDGTFSWRVRAHNSAGWGEWSFSFVFTIQSTISLPYAPNLVYPQPNSMISSSNITFTWTVVPGADYYKLQVLNNNAVIHTQDFISTNSYTITVELSNGTYSWQVCAHNSAGYGPWSNPSTFTLKKQLSVTDIAKFVDRVVYVEVSGYKNGKSFQASGSGFIISPDGKIVTNYHVIDGATSGTVTLNDGRKFNIDYVLGYAKGVNTFYEAVTKNSPFDLAILKISSNNLPTCNLGDSSTSKVGENVVAIGNPLGLPNVVSTGNISKIWDNGIIQITAPLSNGNSGGPLFNMFGEVIGVNTFKNTAGENLNFSIPVNWLKSIDLSNQMTLQQVYQKEYGGSSISLKAPVLISPPDNSVILTTTPTFTWSPVVGAVEYLIAIFKDKLSPDTIELTSYTSNTSYTVPNGKLSYGYKYFWTVFAIDSYGNFNDSTNQMVWSFTIRQKQTLSKPIIINPKEKGAFTDLTKYFDFSWSSVPGAVSYQIWIGLGESGADSTRIYSQGGIYTTSFSVPSSIFVPAQVYTVAVCAFDADGNHMWSDDVHFSVAMSGLPLMISPANGGTLYMNTIYWNSLSDIDMYGVIIYDKESGVKIFSTTTTLNGVSIAGYLVHGKKYILSIGAFKNWYLLYINVIEFYY